MFPAMKEHETDSISSLLFALISDPGCECEGPSPAAEPAAAPYGKQGVRIGKWEREELSGMEQGAGKQECANNTSTIKVCLSDFGVTNRKSKNPIHYCAQRTQWSRNLSMNLLKGE